MKRLLVLFTPLLALPGHRLRTADRCYPDTNVNVYPHAHTYTYSNTDSNLYPYAHTYTYSNTYLNL